MQNKLLNGVCASLSIELRGTFILVEPRFLKTGDP